MKGDREMAAPDTPEASSPVIEPWNRPFRQRIPRPASASAGSPAPWSGLPICERRSIGLDRAVADLSELLLPVSREPEPRPQAAILVTLFERDGDALTALIRRPLSMASNPGDLAFPGGRLEPGENAAAAALREAEEEVGLRPETVSMLGRLPAVSRSRQSESVVPYVGVLAGEPSFRACPGEVDAIIEVALSDLAGEDSYWEEEWHVQGSGSRSLCFFAHQKALADEVIWGMTARVIRDLLSFVLLHERSGVS